MVNFPPFFLDQQIKCPWPRAVLLTWSPQKKFPPPLPASFGRPFRLKRFRISSFPPLNQRRLLHRGCSLYGDFVMEERLPFPFLAPSVSHLTRLLPFLFVYIYSLPLCFLSPLRHNFLSPPSCLFAKVPRKTHLREGFIAPAHVSHTFPRGTSRSYTFEGP